MHCRFRKYIISLEMEKNKNRTKKSVHEELTFDVPGLKKKKPLLLLFYCINDISSLHLYSKHSLLFLLVKQLCTF